MSPENDLKMNSLMWATATIVFILCGSYLVAQLMSFIAKWRGVSPSESRKVFWGFFFASPWLIGFFIFVLGPSLASLYYSFTNYRLGETPQWLGLENYRDLLAGNGASGRRFQQAMWNSLYYALIGMPLQIMASLLMAILLNNNLKGIRVFRLIFYMPVILAGGPAILLAWRYMLSSNGGFINQTLQNLANSFFLFDWLYRGFILVVEGFNGFYSGLTRSDPVGPLVYSLAAVIGVIVLWNLISGDWEEGKRASAQRAAEILSVVIGGLLLAQGLSTELISLDLILATGLIILLFVYLNERVQKTTMARTWQVGGLALFATLFISSFLQYSNQAPDENIPTMNYLLGIAAGSLPIFLSFLPKSLGKARPQVFALTALAFGAVLFYRLAPMPMEWLLPIKYLFMQTAISNTTDLDYLKEGFALESLSVYWIYGILIADLLLLVWFNNRNPRIHRVLLTASLLVFSLFAIGSIWDGLRYFNAFTQIEIATGSPAYHFTLFRTATAQVPEVSRVPLWMSNELWTKPSLILITMWSSGSGMLIFLAALKGVPQSYYEAAEVDGASTWQKFVKITLPIISPAMFYNVVIGIIAALQTFETIFILQNTQTQDSLASAAYYLFQRTFQQAWIGEGAAMSWILALIIVAITIIQFRYSEWVHYE